MEIKKLNEFKKLVESNEKIAFFHHVNPDGDTLSCSYGLAKALKIKYPHKQIVVCGDLEEMKKNCHFVDFNDENFVTEIDNTWLSIVGDCAISKNIRFFDQYKKAKQKICFDHHLNSIDFEVDLYCSNPNYSSSSMQAFEIANFLEVNHTSDSAFHMLIGLLTDSGNFVYSLADPLAPKYYSKLLKYVTNEQMDIFWKRMRNKTFRDLELEKVLIQNLCFKDNVAYIILNKEICKMYPEFLNNHRVHLHSNIEGFPIWITANYFIEKETNEEFWKISLRSNGPNVQQIASKFNGGGHARASGAKIPYNNNIMDVIDEANKSII